GRSMIPTAIVAIVILGLMTGGILLLLNYLRAPSETASNATPKPQPSASVEAPSDTNTEAPPSTDVPAMGKVKIELKVTEDVSVSATTDGTKVSKLIKPDSPETFEPKDSFKVSYSKSLAQAVQLTINGKPITTPLTPGAK